MYKYVIPVTFTQWELHVNHGKKSCLLCKWFIADRCINSPHVHCTCTSPVIFCTINPLIARMHVMKSISRLAVMVNYTPRVHTSVESEAFSWPCSSRPACPLLGTSLGDSWHQQGLYPDARVVYLQWNTSTCASLTVHDSHFHMKSYHSFCSLQILWYLHETASFVSMQG